LKGKLLQTFQNYKIKVEAHMESLTKLGECKISREHHYGLLQANRKWLLLYANLSDIKWNQITVFHKKELNQQLILPSSLNGGQSYLVTSTGSNYTQPGFEHHCADVWEQVLQIFSAPASPSTHST